MLAKMNMLFHTVLKTFNLLPLLKETHWIFNNQPTSIHVFMPKLSNIDSFFTFRFRQKKTRQAFVPY